MATSIGLVDPLGSSNFIFAFRESDEIGLMMLASPSRRNLESTDP